MNFNRFKELWKDKDFIRQIALNPFKAYKAYGQRCTLNEWLSLFHTNEELAWQIYGHTSFDLVVRLGHVTLTAFSDSETDYRYLISFLLNFRPIDKLTVRTNTLNSAIISALEELEELKQLNLIFEQTASFPPLALPNLTKLDIVVTKNNSFIYQFGRVEQFPKLSELTIRGATLTLANLEIIKTLRLNAINLYQTDTLIFPGASVNLFQNKKHVTLSRCEDSLQQNLYSYCPSGLETISINNLDTEFYFSLQLIGSIVLIRSLKKVEIKTRLLYAHHYSALKRLFHAIALTPRCFWEIQIKIENVTDHAYRHLGLNIYEEFVKHLIETTRNIESRYHNADFIIQYE